MLNNNECTGSNHPRKLRRLGHFLVAAASLAVGLAFVGGATLADPPKTIEPGKLNVAMNGDMPMTSIKDGNLIGTDGDVLTLIAERLGLEVVPHQMDWAAVIQSTTQGKVDIMLGAMGWTKERSEVMLLTDPLYYFGIFLVQKDTNNFTTHEDMKGRTVGTVTGFTIVPELQEVEGIGGVPLYDTTDGVLRDLVAGRIDMAIIDPPVTEMIIKSRPEWGLKQLAIETTPEIQEKYPLTSLKYNIVMGINKENPELYEAVNAELAKIWADCEHVKIMQQYGSFDASWFQPPEPNPRAGVDRAKDWQAPNGSHCAM
jgi:polar amino acid transport system substrate-binding protein